MLIGSSRRLPPAMWARPGAVTRWSAETALTAPVGADGQIAHVFVACDSVSWLRRLLAEPAGATRVRRVTLRIRGWRAPRPGWSGRLGPLPGLRWHRVRLPHGAGPAVIELRLSGPAPLRDVLAAALAVLAPVRPLPRPASPDVIAFGAAPPWLAPAANHVAWSGPLPRTAEIRAHDIVLATDPATVAAEPATVGAVFGFDATGARVADRAPPVLIDTAVANPQGRARPDAPGLVGARLSLEADPDAPRWRLSSRGDGPGRPERVLSRGTLRDIPLPLHQLFPVRGVVTVECPELPGLAPAAEATLLAQVAATGAVLHVPVLPAAVGDRLSPPLRELITAGFPPPGADPLELEVRSVRQRRTALRDHGAAFALGTIAARGFPGLAAPPSVSAILVTRRPDYIPDAVRQIAAQTYPELEIVLCLHGMEFDAALRTRLAGCGRPLEIFTAPGTYSFGEVMGAATARARGSLVTKFDDDDVYGPEHVWDLVLAREHSGATLVGRAAEFVYLQTLGVTVRRLATPPETYGPPVAGGTMLMSRGDLEEVGGWRPVPRSVDRGLMDRVLRAGGLIYRTHPLGYVYERRADGHTWDAGLDYFLRRSGQQWDGFPRHEEFGTAELEAGPPG